MEKKEVNQIGTGSYKDHKRYYKLILDIQTSFFCAFAYLAMMSHSLEFEHAATKYYVVVLPVICAIAVYLWLSFRRALHIRRETGKFIHPKTPHEIFLDMLNSSFMNYVLTVFICYVSVTPSSRYKSKSNSICYLFKLLHFTFI